jgi:hypothetical protein
MISTLTKMLALGRSIRQTVFPWVKSALFANSCGDALVSEDSPYELLRRYHRVVSTQLSHHASNVKIAAGGVFKNSADIVAPVVAHMITEGITDFFLVLHNESRVISERLVESFRGRANLTVIHHNQPNFMQAAITNVILSMARRAGFDVFLPFDADEFFVSNNPDRKLREVLSDWVVSGNGEQMIVPMVNYLVPHDVNVFRARTLERMPYRVELTPGSNRRLVSQRLRQHRKSIVRLSGVPFAHQIRVSLGNHSALRGATKVSMFSVVEVAKPPIFVCHIPWRSRAGTLEPPLLARAIGTAAPLGDHTQDADDSEVLLSTWNQYSLTPRMLDGFDLENNVFRLVEEGTCLRILSGILAAEFDPDDEYCASTRVDSLAGVGFTSDVLEDDLMFESAVAAVAGQAHYAVALGAVSGGAQKELRENKRRKRKLLRELRDQRKLVRELRSEINILKSQVRPPSLVRRVIGKCRRLGRQALSRIGTKRVDD